MKAAYSFTKLVVGDLEGMARYYEEVFGLTQLQRVQAEIDGAAIDEIILGLGGSYDGGLILLRWVDQAPPPTGEVILGFATPDIDALFARVEAAGGRVREAPQRSEVAGLVVGFVEDPEGHLAEVIERG